MAINATRLCSKGVINDEEIVCCKEGGEIQCEKDILENAANAKKSFYMSLFSKKNPM